VTTLKLFDNISRKSDILPKLGYGLFWLVLFVASLGASKNAHAAITCDASNTVTANVVVLDSPTVFNRLGAQNPNWITYALARDVVYVDWGNPSSPSHLKPITKMGLSMNNLGSLKGKVELRPDKRPRPLVIRSVAGSCLNVNFTNLLSAVANPNNARQGAGTVGFGEPNPNAQNPACLAVNGGSDPDTGFQPDGVTPFLPNDGVCLNADGDVVPDFLDAGVAFPGLENNDQVAGRCAGFHATGTELFAATKDDGSMVGENDGGGDTGDTNAGQPACGEGLAAPGEYREYNLITPHQQLWRNARFGVQQRQPRHRHVRCAERTALWGEECHDGPVPLGYGCANLPQPGYRGRAASRDVAHSNRTVLSRSAAGWV
jgi:hypothetical protein